MIPISMFAFHVLYTCPLSCAHCCFRSSPKSKEKLDVGLIEKVINDLSDDIKLVTFTGGEPFLLGRDLERLVHCAKNKGFIPRIVTSGYFAKSVDLARLRLQPLMDAGLKELAISWDDFHEEFVRFEVVKNLIDAATEFESLRVLVNIVQGAESRWTSDRLRSELCTAKEIEICETPLNMTGRADDELRSRGVRQEHTLGPCPYVVTGPTISAKGHLLACCGVIPDTDRLYIKKDFSGNNIVDHLNDSKESALFQWLYLRGPYSIMKWMADRHNIAIPGPSRVGGNCEACKILFENKLILDKLDDALEEMALPLKNEFLLLESLGMSGYSGRQNLWGVSV